MFVNELAVKPKVVFAVPFPTITILLNICVGLPISAKFVFKRIPEPVLLNEIRLLLICPPILENSELIPNTGIALTEFVVIVFPLII